MHPLVSRSRLPGALRALACAATLWSTSAQAAFTILDLPNLPRGGFYASVALTSLPDGRLLYGTRDRLLEQNTLGASAVSTFTNPEMWDPAAIAVFDGTHGVVAAGNTNSLYLFNPADVGTAFEAIPNVSLQNFGVAFHTSTSLFVAGANGTGGKASLSIVKTDGSLNKVIIDNAGPYSGAFTLDLAGNLYITNAATRALYKFTAGQIDAAIAGAALNLANFTPLATLKRTGSLAVDARGRIVAGGYAADASFNEIPGFDVYDLATGLVDTFAPTGANTGYVVSTFSDASGDYIGFLDANFTPGTSVKYGYDRVENVPEPVGSALAGWGVLLLLGRRRSVC